MKIFTREVKIGIAGIIALALVIFGINYLKGINLFKPTNYFYVKYSNIMGLTKSSTVFADGYRIGLVREIHYDYIHPGNVIVEIQLDSEMKLPIGTSAEITTEMLGGANVNLLFPAEQTGYFAPGDTLNGKIKSGLMDDVAANIMPKVNEMLPKIDSILSTINHLLGNPNIGHSMEQLRVVSENLASATANLNDFTGRDLPQLTQTINDIGTDLAQFTGTLNTLNLSQTVTTVNNTMANVQSLTDKLNRKDNTVGLLLNDDSLYLNMNRMILNASLTLEDFKARPKRYVGFSLFGGKNK